MVYISTYQNFIPGTRYHVAAELVPSGGSFCAGAVARDTRRLTGIVNT